MKHISFLLRIKYVYRLKLPCEVGTKSWAPWIPCTIWPDVKINCAIDVEFGKDNSWGIACLITSGSMESGVKKFK